MQFCKWILFTESWSLKSEPPHFFISFIWNVQYSLVWRFHTCRFLFFYHFQDNKQKCFSSLSQIALPRISSYLSCPLLSESGTQAQDMELPDQWGGTMLILGDIANSSPKWMHQSILHSLWKCPFLIPHHPLTNSLNLAKMTTENHNLFYVS